MSLPSKKKEHDISFNESPEFDKFIAQLSCKSKDDLMTKLEKVLETNDFQRFKNLSRNLRFNK